MGVETQICLSPLLDNLPEDQEHTRTLGIIALEGKPLLLCQQLLVRWDFPKDSRTSWVDYFAEHTKGVPCQFLGSLRHFRTA